MKKIRSLSGLKAGQLVTIETSKYVRKARFIRIERSIFEGDKRIPFLNGIFLTIDGTVWKITPGELNAEPPWVTIYEAEPIQQQ